MSSYSFKSQYVSAIINIVYKYLLPMYLHFVCEFYKILLLMFVTLILWHSCLTPKYTIFCFLALQIFKHFVTEERWDCATHSLADSTNVPILKEFTSEKCNSFELNTFSTYLSSLLGVTLKSEDKYVAKVFNSTELHFSEVYFFQNWYFC